MSTTLRDQVLELPVADRVEIMMEPFGSLTDEELPAFPLDRLLDLDRVIELHAKNTEQAVRYHEIAKRLWSRCQ